MIRFAQTCDAIARTAPRLEKIALVAGYLREIASDEDLAPAARFFTGNPFAQRDERSLSIGGRTLVDAAAHVWGVSDEQLRVAYRATGDLGAALGPFVTPPVDLGLFRETLAPGTLSALLHEIADAEGKHAQRKRRVLCERILGACTDALEATYVLKIMTGELRIGLREGLVVDAVAAAFDREAADVRRANAAAGDIGAVALAARHDRLADVAVAYHRPVAFMLASPVTYGGEYGELAGGTWIVEEKYDGIRAQAHVAEGRVSLFSRTLNDVGAAYPEVTAALAQISGDAILDGEIVAVRDGGVLPFRMLQARLQRKDVSAALLAEVPVRYVVFDVLARGATFLIDEPLATRRDTLAELLVVPQPALAAAPWTALETGAAPGTIHDLFEAARARGHEGLVFKRSDSPYAPGRRGKAWLKLKRELSTLDCVVVAVERGHGRRKDVLSDYTFAVLGDDGDLAPIGKAYSGLTDAEIAEMTVWFEAHRLPPGDAARRYRELALRRHEILVEPQIVVEIAFDVIQRSSLHASGYALRFPRIVRLRPDKPPDAIDTLARVREIETEMLAREGV